MNIKKNLTPGEIAVFKQTTNLLGAAIVSMFYTVMENIDNKQHITYTSKSNGEWGYYPSVDRASVIAILLRKYGLNSIVDLGSGAGLLLLVLKYLGYTVKGIENEINFVKFSHKLKIPTQYKSILDLTKRDVKAFDCIYLYEPIRDESLCEKFVEALKFSTYKDQYIFYCPAGSIDKYLRINSLYFKFIEEVDSIKVYQRL